MHTPVKYIFIRSKNLKGEILSFDTFERNFGP